jgi:hypothetical protein
LDAAFRILAAALAKTCLVLPAFANLSNPIFPCPHLGQKSRYKGVGQMAIHRPRGDDEARPDEIGTDRGQVGSSSAGQSGDTQQLSDVADASEDSVENLEETGQDTEALIVDGVEDAADHPERPVHTHLEYGRPDDLAPVDGNREDAA